MRWMLCGALATLALNTPPATAADDTSAAAHVQFVEDFVATCVQRNGVQIQVRNTHPSRTIRIWLDRVQMGVGTGDRSRSELPPKAEPEPLGCSRTLTGTQEWKLVRAQFVD